MRKSHMAILFLVTFFLLVLVLEKASAAAAGGIGSTGGAATTNIYVFSEVTPTAPAVIKNIPSVIGLTQLSIEFKITLINVEVTVNQLAEKPTGITEEVSGKAYKYIEISSRKNVGTTTEVQNVKYEGTIGTTAKNVEGFLVKLSGFTAAIPSTMETAAVAAKAKIDVDGTAKDISVGSTEVIGSLSIKVSSATAEGAVVSITGKKTVTIATSAPTNIADNDISKVTINFEVEKSWILNNNIGKNTVTLYRYTTEWGKLPTNLVSERADFIDYQTISPGLSTFAIFGGSESVSECPTCPLPSDWSECINSKQTRTNYRCGMETSHKCQDYIEEAYCKTKTAPPIAPPTRIPPKIPSVNLMVIVGGVVLVAIIGIVYTLGKYKSLEKKVALSSCPKCGKELTRRDRKFCTKCGEKL